MKKLLLIAFTFTIFNNSYGQWSVTTGPIQPNILSIATEGMNTFAAAGTSVSLTSNNGTNWSLVNNGLSGQIYSVITKGTDLYVGASGGNVFQSSNNGANWISMSTGLPSTDIRSLTVSGSDIYAATYGVYKSTNNGLLWTQLNQSWNASVLSIAVSGSTILAGTANNGCYISVNGGLNWNTINNGLPTSLNVVAIFGTTFLAGASSGLYISTNNGASWALTNVTDAINSFHVVGNNIFAGSSGGGVFLSTNGGTSWSSINNGLSNLNVFSLATNNTYIFAGTSGYVWKRPLSEVLPITYSINTSSAPSNGGTTSGGGSYATNSLVTVNAIPNSGFIFCCWKENGTVISTNNNYTFTATSNRTLVAEFSQTTEIHESILNNNLNVFPNPSDGRVNIVSNEKQINSVTLFDASGRSIQTFNVSGKQVQISLEGIESGIYFLSINGERNSLKKIVIQ